jgi:hypothetical protein
VALPVHEQSQEEQRIANVKTLADPPPSLHFRAKGGRHAL